MARPVERAPTAQVLAAQRFEILGGDPVVVWPLEPFAEPGDGERAITVGAEWVAVLVGRETTTARAGLRQPLVRDS